jgi:Secretion system C-terminal sorting domain
MKKSTIKFILGVSAVLAFSGAKAQFPIITSLNQVHSAGDSIHYIDLNPFGFDPIVAGGQNVVWSYGALFPAGTTVDFVYKVPSTQPSAASYPTATASMVNSSVAGNEWFKEDADSIIRLGLSSPNPDLGDLVYDNGAFIRIKFPFTAGNSWATPNYTGTQSGDFGVAGTIITIANGSFNTLVDAFGTMTLPNGTVLNDVVRTHVIESFEYFGDIGIGTPISLGVISDDYYYWWVEGIQDPIMISGTTLTNGGSPSDVLRYQPILPTEINEKIALESKVNIYPNPGNGLFNINISNLESGVYKLNVANILGENVYTNSVTATGNRLNSKMDISELNKGIYFVSISNASTEIVEKIIIK